MFITRNHCIGVPEISKRIVTLHLGNRTMNEYCINIYSYSSLYISISYCWLRPTERVDPSVWLVSVCRLASHSCLCRHMSTRGKTYIYYNKGIIS